MPVPAEARHHLAPSLVMLAAIAVCLAAAALTAGLAVFQPWMGVGLAAQAAGAPVGLQTVWRGGPASGATASAGGFLTAVGRPGEAPLPLVASDLIEEPDGLESYPAAAAFLARQSELAQILRSPRVELQFADRTGAEARTIVVEPRMRPVGSLPPVFWVQLLSGLAGFLIGAWVWAMRRRDLGAGMFALSGVGLLVSALPAAVYSTRELALDGRLFAWLAALNHIGAHLFGGAMIALFLSYPRRLVAPAWLLVIPAILVPWLWADVAGRMPDPVTGMYAPMLAEMALIVALVVLQVVLARGDPVTRAALRWLGLSVTVGAGAFVAAIAVPLLLGVEPAISQGYAFAFFLLVYGGIALGIHRYRLFDLGDWSFRLLFYAGGAVLLLLLDSALIWVLQIERAPALGVSLLIVGFAYLPLRDALGRRLYAKRMLPEHELFAAAMDVAFGLTRAERAERWRGLLSRIYDPLEIAPAAGTPGDKGDYSELVAPATADSPPLKLRFPFGGKGMFGPPDFQLANQLAALVAKAESSRDAYERGVMEERQRIARDLHDDLGARLLAGLHSGDAKSRPLLQAALADVRAIVSGLGGEPAPLDQVLAEARHETAWRLDAAGIRLDWALPEESAEPVILDYRRSKALISSIREVFSNIIRHSNATEAWAEVDIGQDAVTLVIRDNGRGMPTVADGRGYGLRSIRGRVEEIGGRLSIRSGPSGVTMEIVLPLGDGRGAAVPGGGADGGTRTHMT